MTNEESVAKLIEIKDNLHKKRYLKALVGDKDDLEGLMEFILEICDGIDPDDVDARQMHKILYRTAVRIFSVAVRKYVVFSDSFDKLFSRLCGEKNRYFARQERARSTEETE